MAIDLGSIYSRFRVDFSKFKTDARESIVLSQGLKNSVSGAAEKSQSRVKRLTESFGNLRETLKRIKKEGGQSFDAISGSLGGLIEAAGASRVTIIALGAALAAIGLALFAKAAANAAAEIRALKIAFVAAADSAEIGAQEFAFVQRESERLGLELRSTASAYKGLIAATVASGKSAEVARFIFDGVTDAAAAMRLTTEETKGTLLALQQIMSKGKVSAEELRQQLGERFPVAVGLMAEALGITTAKLSEMLDQGKLTSDALIPLAAKLKEKYGKQAAEGAKSFGAELNRLKNAGFDLLRVFGEAGFLSIAIDIVKMLKSFVNILKNLLPIIYPIIAAIKVLSFSLRILFRGVELLIDGIKFLGLALVKYILKILDPIIDKIKTLFKLLGFLTKKAGAAFTALKQTLGFKSGEASAVTGESPADRAKRLLAGRDPLGGDKKDAAKKAAKAARDALTALVNLRRQMRTLLEKEQQLQALSIEGAEKEVRLLEHQRDAKLALIAYDRETANAQIAQLEKIARINSKEKARVDAQIAVLRGKLQELDLTEQIVRRESDLAIQTERRAKAHEDLLDSIETSGESAAIQGQIRIEQLRQEGASQKELAALQFETAKQQLIFEQRAVEAKIAQARLTGENTAALERDLGILQQRNQLLREQIRTENMKPILEMASSISDALTGAVRDFITDFAAGTENIADTLTGLGQSMINSSLKPLLDEMQASLNRLFVKLGTQFGSFGGLFIGGVLSGLGFLFKKQKSQVESLADKVKDNIQSTENVRGLIAGENQIAVAQLSQNLAEAFRPTNDLLMGMDAKLAIIARQLGGRAAALVATGGGGGVETDVLAASGR